MLIGSRLLDFIKIIDLGYIILENLIKIFKKEAFNSLLISTYNDILIIII